MEVTTQPPDAATRLQPGPDWDPTTPSAAGFTAIAMAAANAGAQVVTVAAHPATPDSDAAAEQSGFETTREMLQLRRSLPIHADTPALAVRAFRPGTDDDRWLEVNRRAFAWHPDQGSWTASDLAQRLAEPWFDPEGFLVHDAAEPGSIDAFCWTKVHSGTDAEGAIGEIYVIAVDPVAHGRGLGKAMVLAGLGHLHARGMVNAMLYVEGDNSAGLALYQALGFHEHERHRWYTWTANG